MAISDAIVEFFQPEKIILFGSYAKGTYVEDRYREDNTIYEYLSDYDILVVTKDEAIKDYLIRDKITNRFAFDTPINILPHSKNYVNQGLLFGQYFFTDIVTEGVLLYDVGNFQFSTPKLLTKQEEKIKAQDYFDMWSDVADEFLIDATNAFQRKSFKKAAFELHQATENYYNTTLLVFTGYKPKTHNLDKLRVYTKSLSEELFTLFLHPADDALEKHLFDLLKRGYIEARYKKDYFITEDEIEKILLKVNEMKTIVEEICKLKISSLT